MPTRFYKEREHTVEGLKVHRDSSSSIFFKVFAFLARSHLSLVERLIDHANKIYKGKKYKP